MKVLIIGGLGHIGLTLAAVLDKHYEVVVQDISDDAILAWQVHKEAVFFEPGLNELLRNSSIRSVRSLDEVKSSDVVIITVGTPVDEHLNPVLRPLFSLFHSLVPLLNDDQLIIMRSTVYPGLTKKLEKMLLDSNLKTKIAFCPERVAGGKMVEEITSLPQIVAANDEKSLSAATIFFSKIGIKVKQLNNTTSGELAKLFTNAYRYVHFAIANQFFMLAQDADCDFYEIYDAITDEYPRMKGFPRPGYTCGYCLEKDSIQLASWNKSFGFQLAYNAMLVNEHLPLFVFRKIRDKFGDLKDNTVGLLGMSFLEGTDDTRESLSFRMKKILENECKLVLCTDPLVKRDYFVSLEELVEKSDIIILMTRHSEYKNLRLKKPVVDIWNFFEDGVGLQ